MNIDEKLNTFLFLFASIVFLYSFFTTKTFISETGTRMYTTSASTLITPIVIIMCMLKMLKLYEPIMNRTDKKQVIRNIKLRILDKYYEGVKLNEEWKNRKKL